MQSNDFFKSSTHEFGERTREVVLPNSDHSSHIGHSIRIVNRGNSDLLVRTNNKKWKLAAKATQSFSYDGTNWTKKEVAPVKKVDCPRDSSSDSCSSSSSSSSEDESCKRGPRGPPGRDGCPGANGLNGKNGKNGKCQCTGSQNVLVLYSGTGLTYNTTVQVPCWAKTALVTSVGGGGAGGAATLIADRATAGSGGGSGFSITQPVPTSGGFLSLSIGQGGQGGALTSTSGNPTVVTYTGSLPYAVYAAEGHHGGSLPAGSSLPHVSDGQNGGGGGGGSPQSPPGRHGFSYGHPAVTGVSGGNGGGYLPGLGGASVPQLVAGGGGGGGAPGPIAAAGGNGGGSVPSAPLTQLNGGNGSYGSGGGGAAVQTAANPAVGISGNGGNGYVNIVFLA